MFCEPDDPCEAHQPKAKSAARKRSKAKPTSSDDSIELSPSTSTSPSVPTGSSAAPAVDVTAAMKAAAQGSESEDQVLIDSKKRSRLQGRDEYEKQRAEEMAELRRIVFVLEPILHPLEKKKYASWLNTPSARAQLWKERRASGL